MNRVIIGICLIGLIFGGAEELLAQRGAGRGPQGRGFGRYGMQSDQGMRGQLGAQQGNFGNRTDAGRRSVQDATDLAKMWEEEKLARDVYTRLAATSGLRIFQNISRSENQHMQAIARLASPNVGNQGNLRDVPGQFAFPEYQQLYNQLVRAGSTSPLDALKVGAKIEEMDIRDLQELLSKDLDPRTRQTLERLLRASHQHLRAFASQLSAMGASYDAQFLSQAEFDAIANGKESGKGARAGQGAGAGKGARAGKGAGAMQPGTGNGGPANSSAGRRGPRGKMNSNRGQGLR